MALCNDYQKVISTTEVAKYLDIESERNSSDAYLADIGISKKKIIEEKWQEDKLKVTLVFARFKE